MTPCSSFSALLSPPHPLLHTPSSSLFLGGYPFDFNKTQQECHREMKLNQQLNMEKDFLDVLLEFEGNEKDESDKISDRNLNILILELMTAGTEATVTTIEWVMTELLRNPETMKKVQIEITEVVGHAGKIEETDIDNLPYLCAVAKETSRLHPGPFLVPRSVVKETKFTGYWIPKDTLVFVNAWALGRDPSVWDDPSSFKLERSLGTKVDYRGLNFEFLPFGAGRRIFPGLPLAHKMLHLVLGCLLQSFEWTLDAGVTLEHRPGRETWHCIEKGHSFKSNTHSLCVSLDCM